MVNSRLRNDTPPLPPIAETPDIQTTVEFHGRKMVEMEDSIRKLNNQQEEIRSAVAKVSSDQIAHKLDLDKKMGYLMGKLNQLVKDRTLVGESSSGCDPVFPIRNENNENKGRREERSQFGNDNEGTQFIVSNLLKDELCNDTDDEAEKCEVEIPKIDEEVRNDVFKDITKTPLHSLGHLASCFLDPLTTLYHPAWGYEFRHKYGLEDLVCATLGIFSGITLSIGLFKEYNHVIFVFVELRVPFERGRFIQTNPGNNIAMEEMGDMFFNILWQNSLLQDEKK